MILSCFLSVGEAIYDQNLLDKKEAGLAELTVTGGGVAIMDYEKIAQDILINGFCKNQVIKVLMIENSTLDAELIMAKLSKAGYVVDLSLVDNARDMKKLLSEKNWDVVICEYFLTGFNPFEALKILKKLEVDIPFIVISGKIGEENVVQLMKEGCHDCVMKNNISKLPSVITRELEAAKVRNDKRISNLRLQKYQIIAQKNHDAMLFLDKEGNILEVNESAKRLYGYTGEEFMSMKIFDLSCAEEKSFILEQIYGADQDDSIFETLHYNKYGTPIYVEISAQGTILDNEQLLCIVRDVTEHKKIAAKNLYLSSHDVLTGLFNRSFGEEEIKRLDIYENLPISIIMADVNGLKMVNDAFGYHEGDKLLKQAALIIQSVCTTYDKVVRWGGDEYIIIMPKTNKDEAGKTVKRMKSLYANQQTNSINVSISFGWDTKEQNDADIMQVLTNSEDDMYRNKHLEGESARRNIIHTIITTLHEKNPREERHSKRVSAICQRIGETLGLSTLEISKLKVVGLLHDIGKIALDESILNKKGRLTGPEWKQIKRHPDIGYRIISTSHEMLDLANCILAHHERWDGNGYPRGLRGEAIPMLARIIAIADAYDAMTNQRTYRKPMSEAVAKAEISKKGGTQFDPEIARIFAGMALNNMLIADQGNEPQYTLDLVR
jgi:diguanylate cyclase (GGDEF)-like protein/PAS domain S-box-containing protein